MNNIEGRDLDAACARAMGWTIDGYADIDGDGPSVARWKRGSDYELRIMEPLNDPPPPRRYSTDPSTLDEKLARSTTNNGSAAARRASSRGNPSSASTPERCQRCGYVRWFPAHDSPGPCVCKAQP